MQSPKTWRELLGAIISDPAEEQRLIALMGIRPITLLRWVQNKSVPRPYFLHQLLNALPQHRDIFLPLLEKEFPGFAEQLEDEIPQEISASPCMALVAPRRPTPQTIPAMATST